MTGFSLVLVLSVLVLLAFAFAFSGAAPIVALPIAAVAIAGVAVFDFRRRRKAVDDVREFRNQAKTENIDFSEHDKETLASD